MFEKTREILSKYELTGISKNSLIVELQNEQIASRMTVLEYLDEMADPKRGNIIELRIPEGKINPLCFPTKSNLVIVKLKEKFKTVVALLDLVEKNPLTGDLFGNIPSLKDFPKLLDLEPDTGHNQTSMLFMEIIHPKKNPLANSEFAILLNSHSARKNLLQFLSLFLTTYLNLPKIQLSKQIKEECIKIITPIILRSFRILNDDYSQSLNISKEVKEIIQNSMPDDSIVSVELVKGTTMPHVETEFVKILGRYYYSISKKFTKDMQYDCTKEQKVISKFLTDFYVTPNSVESVGTLDDHDIKSIVKNNANNRFSRDKESTIKNEYDLDPDSLALRLAKTFENNVYNDDAFHIKKYYMELFAKLGLFNKKEQQILDYVLNQEQTLLKSIKPDDLNLVGEIHSKLFPEFYAKHKNKLNPKSTSNPSAK